MVFEHMRDIEKAIWMRVLAKEAFVGEFEYDVHVGEGKPVPELKLTEKEAEMAKRLTQKRIDVVEHTPAFDRLIEIKRRLHLGALGQLLGYRELYRKIQPVTKPIRLAVVCEEDDPDLRGVFAAQDIDVFIV